METTKANAALDELGQLGQWVAWGYEPRPGKKPAKAPIDPHTWADAKTDDPNTWGTYEEALAASPDENSGFVFTKGDQYCGIDLDNCVDPETAVVEPWAEKIVEALDSYTELSPSGTGLKIWIKATKPGTRCRIKHETGEVEIYDHGRFFTFTGRQYGDCDGIQNRQDELNDLYAGLFEEPKEDLHGGTTEGGFPGDDQALLSKARSNAVTGERFVRLYDRGLHVYKSQSEADMALCGFLAYWAGRDEERMERLFMGSALALTIDRHSDPDDYLDRTIAKAVRNCKNTYDPDYGKKSRPKVEEVLEACTDFVVWGSWKGRGVDSCKDVYAEMIYTGFLYGKLVDGGVAVSASVRSLAGGSGIGQEKTVRKALKKLEDDHGLIERIEDGRQGKAATYLIKGCARLPHINNRVNTYGVLSRTTRRVRNPSIRITTIGKRNAGIILFVHAQGRAVTIEDVASHFSARPRDLRKRNIPTLLDAGLLIEKEGGYVTPDDVNERLLGHLESGGSLEVEREQRQRYEREREAYRRAVNVARMENEAGEAEKPDPVEEEPTPIPAVSVEEEHVMRKNLPEKNENDAPEYVLMKDKKRTAA